VVYTGQLGLNRAWGGGGVNCGVSIRIGRGRKIKNTDVEEGGDSEGVGE
jgi:hypothetical protein